MSIELVIAAVSAVFFLGIVLTPLILRTGAPLLLLFLGLGMLLGQDGPGGYAFNDFELAYHLGSIALAVILFAGGLETELADVRKAWAPAFTMATVGVCLTTGILGVLVSLLFGLPIERALLLGAVVGSTDAAATFMLLQQRGIRLAGRIKQTILLESGLNDPFAIFLTLFLLSVVDASIDGIGWSSAIEFFLQIGLGLAFGVAGGRIVAHLVNTTPLLPGMFPVFVLSGGLMVFGVTAALGGSGFLAVYLCGVVVSARVTRTVERIISFHAAMAWIGQIGLFVMLGLLVNPSELPSVALPALAMAGLLIFVARPLATIVCLTPFRFPIRHQAFIGWVGLRGAVPIFLAILPVLSIGPVTVSFFNEVFIIVIASLVLQGWTIGPMARLLGVEVATPPAGNGPASRQ